MTQRQKVIIRLLVVFPTIGWAGLAPAAIMTDAASLRQPAGEEALGMSPVSRRTAPPLWRLEREPGPRHPWDRLLPQDRATAPTGPSTGFSMDLTAGVDASLSFSPPLLVVFVLARVDLVLPNPIPSQLLRPPRWALIAG